MPNVYVIIPHYNKWDLTHPRLWELYKHSKEHITEVLVVDDCSNDDMTEGGLRWWASMSVKQDFRVRAIRTESNLHFLRASNFGIDDILKKSEPEDIIILLSNDVLVLRDFVGQVKDILSHPKKLVGGVLLSKDTGWNKFGDKVFPYLEGWLLAATAEGWKELGGGFDTRYKFSDFEDVDLSTTALSLGYELVPLNNPALNHLGGMSIGYNPEREARTKANRKKFERKWIRYEKD